MEAKDTIALNLTLGIYDYRLTIVEKELVEWVKKGQAEVSFKAGIKEVVEWLKKNLPDEYGSIREWTVWQAKLKEWGIK